MRRSMLATALALLLLLSACGGTAPEPTPSPSPSPSPTPAAEAAEFALPRTGGSLHPILSSDRVNLTLSSLMWEGLFALDGTFTPQQVLCKGYAVSEDGLVWTFWLQEGVTFSDGSPLTAQDVVSSLLLAKGPGSRYAARLEGVRSAAELNGTVVLTLSTPNGNLPALLDIPVVRGESEQPVGTGPYVLEDDGETAVLTARSGWWQKKALPIRSIPLRTVPEADDLISAFDTGEVSLVTADLTGTNSMGYGGSYETWDYPTTSMVYVGFQCGGDSLCADPALRRALAHGLDRSTVAGALYARHAAAAALPVSPSSPLYDEAAAGELAYSPQVLADLLTQAGWEKNADGVLAKGRNLLTLDFIVNTDNSFRLSAAEYIAAELTRAGAAVNLRRLSWSDYQAALEKGDFDLYLGEALLTAGFDLTPLLEAGGSLNYGRYSDPDTSALLAAFRAAGEAQRKAAASALYARLCQEAPIAAVCFKNQSLLTQWGMVSGVTPTQQDPFYGIENWRLTDRLSDRQKMGE